MWLGGVFLGVVAQTCNYLSALTTRPRWFPSPLPFTPGQQLRARGFWIGVAATVIAGLAAFQAATNWGTLPMTAGLNLNPGQLYDDGGVVVVGESDERRAMWERLRSQSMQQK